MPLSRGPYRRALPSMVLALTGLAMIMATTAWLGVRSRERDQLIRDHVEAVQVLAETGAAGVTAILDGFGSDLDRLSRLPSVRYLEQPDRLERTLDSFIARTSVPTRGLIRVDTAGRVLFVHPADSVPETIVDALRESGYLDRAGSSATRLVSAPLEVPGEPDLLALSDLIQPDDRDPLGAIIALFPASFLANPIERGVQPGGGWAVLRDARGNILHSSAGDQVEGADAGTRKAGDGFVGRAAVLTELEPPVGVELWSTREQALGPLRESFPGALFLLLLTNGLIATGGGFLARELWLRRRLNDSLVRRRELERRLQEAQKLESLGRLAGGIAHDFNNALTAIQGSARLLEEKLDHDDPDREETSAILQASGHATQLTRQLLAFARRQTLHPQVIDLNAAMQRIEPLLQRTLPADVHISAELGSQPLWIRIDPTHLEQVLLNLAVNARDAMPDGGSLRISTDHAAADAASEAEAEGALGPDRYARLTISDEGEGIAAEDLPHIFEPFFTTKPAGDGTGLGLATVYGIVKQSGGDIQVESAEGKGTRFIVLFPRAEAPQLKEKARESAQEDPGAAAVPDGGATILLVEDNEGVRRLAERALSRRGHRIISAESGEEALGVLSDPELCIDLLLTDVVMPGMNGRELASRLTAARPGTPVLFMSGYMEDEVLRRGIESTDTRFLEKPFTPDDLARSVREALTSGASVKPRAS